MDRDIESLLAALTREEKTSLLAGAGLWSTVGVPRLGIPPVFVTDGPNGARGPALPDGDGSSPTAACLPCGSALGATWDTELVARVGALIGREARRKACRVLLAPTVNLHRSPLGGRNFESYSEDPLLAGRLAAAFVRGAQGEGVACTVKHFAANESETDRYIADSAVDERTLRELYLVPFELAVREGGALGVMTAYNRLNGVHCSDHAWLLRDVLRGEWGFDGFVVSDWFALTSTEAAIEAGLDLEMPGPGRAYGPALAAALDAGTVQEHLVDAAVRRLLTVLDRVGALDDAPAAPRAEDLPEDRALAREAAASAMVLLHNDDVLPLDAGTLRRVAVIGPNAGRAVIMGGGSASLPVHYERTPLDALRDRLGPAVEVHHEPGVDISLATPEIPAASLHTPEGRPGMRVTFHRTGDVDGEVLGATDVPTGAAVWFGAPPVAVPDTFSFRAVTELRVEHAARWTLSMVQTGPSTLLVDGEVRIDGTVGARVPGTDFFGMAERERTVELDLAPDRPVHLEVRGECGRGLVRGVKLGLRVAPAADGIARAVAAARDADATVVVVGTDAHWEVEGTDRTTLALPGEQDELVRRVLEVAPHAVIVLNTGAPVVLPWIDGARAVLQTWFGGQEMADALADVVLGLSAPGGRLPTTMPLALEHSPSHGHFPAEGGVLRYGEGVFVGYRGHEHRGVPVRFPFGHGLGYTTFASDVPEVSAPTFAAGDALTVRVRVTNTGARAGKEVVQLYVAACDPRVARPPQELRAFATVHLAAGASTTVELVLDDRAFARWSAPDPALDHELARLGSAVPWVRPPAAVAPRGWAVDAGRYELRIGRSSAAIDHIVPVDVLDAGTSRAGR